MDIGQALLTSIGYEKRVLSVYSRALEDAKSSAARRVYELLAKEERDHVAYLENKLTHWRSAGTLDASYLATAVPSVEKIREGVARLVEVEKREAPPEELGALKRALEVEKETSDFYGRMATELDGEGRLFFERFNQIEAGHLALVAAELGTLEGSGHWFDVAEFRLETA